MTRPTSSMAEFGFWIRSLRIEPLGTPMVWVFQASRNSCLSMSFKVGVRFYLGPRAHSRLCAPTLMSRAVIFLASSHGPGAAYTHHRPFFPGLSLSVPSLDQLGEPCFSSQASPLSGHWSD